MSVNLIFIYCMNMTQEIAKSAGMLEEVNAILIICALCVLLAIWRSLVHKRRNELPSAEPEREKLL